MVSHDLRNPLATARMSLEMIADKLAQAKADDALVQDGLQITTRSLSAMETLINNLLDHAKIESGRLTLSHQRCDTDAFLADIELRFAPLAKRRGLRFRVERDRGLPCMYWDSARVEQVLSNLLGNAFKFSPGGTEVVLSARHQDAALLLSVRDQGPGLAPDEANHVFDRYWQARERSHYGQGLGLAIAKAIVTAHKGEIWVVSERGKGSEFLFTIPLTAEALNEASV
jgi:signal transduction histidine kinase